MLNSPFSTLPPDRQKVAYQRAADRVADVKGTVPDEIRKIRTAIQSKTASLSLRASVPEKLQCMFSPARNKGAHGGRGSSKSWSFGTLLVDKARRQKGLRAVCVREIQKSLEQSVKRLLEDTIIRHGVGSEFNVLNTHIETPGGGIIIFQGMQNHTAETIKSLEGYDIAWVEEAQSLSQRSLDLLRPTIRKADSELWFTWNPRFVSDPIDQYLRHGNAPPDSTVVEVNFHDNPFFPSVLQKEMEWDRSRDVDKYEHVWLGGYEKSSSNRVFNNWRIEDFDTPRDAYFLFGGDFGFSVDPTTLVRCYVVGRRLYVDAEAYMVGCEIDRTPELYDSIDNGMARNWTIIADCARPETISYLQRHGYPLVEPAVKGKDSVKEGIEFLKNYDIVVHSRCTHTIDELTHYSYKVHPLTGETTPVLSDKKNHVIDSLRYAVEKVRQVVEEEMGVVW